MAHHFGDLQIAGAPFAWTFGMRAFSCLLLLVACGDSGGSTIDAPVDVPPSSPDAPVFAGEVLKNGDFEIADGNGWLANWENADGNPDGEINIVTDLHRSGAQAVQWQIDAAGDGREYFVVQHGIDAALLVPGQTYELTGWYMFDHLGEIAFNYIVRGQPGDEPNIDTTSEAITPPTVVNTWVPFTFDITIPLGVSPTSYLFYLHSIKYTGQPVKMTVDSVSLHPKP
jgi:hypothetical protein